MESFHERYPYDEGNNNVRFADTSTYLLQKIQASKYIRITVI